MNDDQTRHPGEKEEPKSSCKDCCERVAWSSFVAAIITVIGVVLVVVCVGLNSHLAGPLFSNTVIETAVYTWFSWIQIGAYVGLVLMIAIVFILSSSGCMATGYQNASTWCAFNKAQTGRRQLTAFMILAYIVNLGWYVFTFGAAMPTVFFMMLNNGVCTNTAYTDLTCLDLRQFGLAPQSLPAAVNSTLICGQNLQDICNSSLGSNFILALIGCILVLIGMNHFLMSISGNYNWLRLRKRRQKIMAGQMNRRSGTYDVNTSPYVERQDSRDSNAHLRRVNLHHGSSSNILTSSTTSIPTVAANVPPVVITTSSTFAMPPSSSSSSKKEPASNSSSMQSSKISNQTYGFDDGGFSQPSSASARVTFADSKPTSTVAPRSNTASSKRSTAEDKNDLSKYADRNFENSNRYDHFNPAFDENYWDRQKYDHPPEHPKFDNYYSRSYSDSSKMNGRVANYDQGNFNQAYYNYDYDAADGQGFQMSPRSKSSYGEDASQPVAQDTNAIGNKQAGRYQANATSASFYGKDSSEPSAQNGKGSSYSDAGGGYKMNTASTYGQHSSTTSTQNKDFGNHDRGRYGMNTASAYGQDSSQWQTQNTNAAGDSGSAQYRESLSSSYGQDSSQSLAQDRKAIGNNFFEYQL